MDWIKSVRAVSVILFIVGLHVALFIGILPVAPYVDMAKIVITAYFIKRTVDR